MPVPHNPRTPALPAARASVRTPVAGALAVWLASLPAGGCSTGFYVRDADDQVYGILDSATEQVTGQPKHIEVNRPVETTRQRLLAEGGTLELTLRDALDIASENNRQFQSQREQLYLAGLNLTGQLNNFEFQWFGGGAADVDGVGGDDASLRLQDDLSTSVNTISGASIVFGFVNTFFRPLVTGNGSRAAFDASSILNLSLTQPLLRDYGARVNRESLTQSERNVVYQVRSFERFRATLAVDVFSQYLRVLQQVQNLVNQENNLESRSNQREQIEANFEAGRQSTIDLDRARQAEFIAQDQLQVARNRVQASLDSLKLTLGLPTDCVVSVDASELSLLEQVGVVEVEIAQEAAVELALTRRYQYRTALDQVEDAVRRVLVAEDGLDPGLDLSAAVALPTDPDEPLNFDPARVQWSAGLELDLPFERTAARNAYRAAIISMNAEIRSREQLEDQIKLQVRNALRDVGVAYRSYQIQTKAVQLAEDRVRSADLLVQAGRANVNDAVDAADSLIAAQLQQTAALVDYTVARLALIRDLEALAIEPKGLRFDRTLPIPAMPETFGRFDDEPTNDSTDPNDAAPSDADAREENDR